MKEPALSLLAPRDEFDEYERGGSIEITN